MNHPKVSVIVPIYKVEKYIERCVRSLFEQILDDIEYIFIDDCTPDDSIAILLRVLEDYPHRKEQSILHRMETNSGQAAVRKWGMLNCTGEYVIHCDPDDYIEKDMYERMYKCAKETDSDIVRCKFDWVDGSLSRLCFEIPEPDYSDNMKLVSHLLLGHDLSSMWDKLVRRSMISEEMIFPQNDMMEDFVLSLQFLLSARKTFLIRDCLYHYCQNQNSISYKADYDSYIDRYADMIGNVRLSASILEANNLSERFKDEIVAAKVRIKNVVRPLVSDNRFRRMWLDSFPDVDFNVIWCKKIPLIEKMKYISVRTNIYPLLHKISIAYYRFRK